MDESSERALIRRFQAGEQNAYDDLVEAFQRRTLSLALHILRNEEAALDAAQEVFLRAFEELPRWRGEARFGTWLYRTALNVCFERIRAEEKQRRVRDAARPVIVTRSPEETLLKSELLEAIDEAVRQLPPRQRAVFVMKQYEDLRFTQIATLMETTEGGAKASYHKALMALREHLKRYLPELASASEAEELCKSPMHQTCPASPK